MGGITILSPIITTPSTTYRLSRYFQYSASAAGSFSTTASLNPAPMALMRSLIDSSSQVSSLTRSHVTAAISSAFSRPIAANSVSPARSLTCASVTRRAAIAAGKPSDASGVSCGLLDVASGAGIAEPGTHATEKFHAIVFSFRLTRRLLSISSSLLSPSSLTSAR